MLPISSCLDIEHDISSKDNVIVKHMITGMVKNGLTILSLLLFLLIFLLESSTTLQWKMATIPPTAPTVPPVAPITQLINILIMALTLVVYPLI